MLRSDLPRTTLAALFIAAGLVAGVTAACAGPQEESAADSAEAAEPAPATATQAEAPPAAPAPPPGEAPAPLGDAPAPQAETVDPQSLPEVVATVDGAEITRDELLARASSVQSRRTQAGAPPVPATTSFYRDITRQLVGVELLLVEAREAGLEAGDEQVAAQLEQIKGQFPSPEVFSQALVSQGMNEEELAQSLEADLTIQNLIEQRIAPETSVEEGAERAFYEENVDQMQRPEAVKVSHILVSVDAEAGEEAQAEARTEAEALLERARGGEEFAALAREASDDPQSAERGGDLDWVERGTTVPPFEAAAFSLPPGEISDLVETRFGYHILRVAEKREGGTVPFPEVEERIRELLEQQAIEAKVQAKVEELIAGADVEYFL